MRIICIATLALAALGCDDDGADGGDGGVVAAPDAGAAGLAPFDPTAAAETARYAAAYDAMLALARQQPFGAEQIGDPAPFEDSEAATPTDPGQLSSLYFETGGLRAAVAAARDRRAGVQADDGAGDGVASRMVNALTIGFASAGTTGRGSPAWHARQGVRGLDQFQLLAVWGGLAERSTAGFDRALGYLWSGGAPDAAPHGLGALLAETDAACGTDFLATIEQTLTDVREPFAAAIEEKGLPDPLDRLVIAEGDSPAYDAAIVTVERALTRGLATAMLRQLEAPLDVLTQAELLGAYGALSARVAASADAADQSMSVTLDAADPAEVDREEARRILTEHLEVEPCGG